MGLELRHPVQVAYGVRDVDAAAQRFAELTGAGPFFVNRHIALATGRRRWSCLCPDHSTSSVL
jgi:hypothetical protein